MSYEPTNWKDGDLVTSAKLNKIEQGIAAGGGILIVHIIQDGENLPTLDKTWQEIHDADVCYIIGHDNEHSISFPIIQTDIINEVYQVSCVTQERLINFIADSPNSTLTMSV